MGYKDDLKNFKDPVKQMGKNFKTGISDGMKDFADRIDLSDYDDDKQQKALEFYSVDFSDMEKTYGINMNSPAISILGGRYTWTFGTFGVRIKDIKYERESIYFRYDQISQYTVFNCKKDYSGLKKGALVTVICTILGVAVNWLFYIGTLIGILYLGKNMPGTGITLTINLDNFDRTDPNTGELWFEGIKESDWKFIVSKFYQGAILSAKNLRSNFYISDEEKPEILNRLSTFRQSIEASTNSSNDGEN